MADHTTNALRAAAKAAREIAPAIDPSDPLAKEQLALIGEFLEFLHERIDHVHERQRFELANYTSLGEALAADAAACSEVVASRLEGAVATGRALLERPQAGGGKLKAATAGVTAVISELVRAADGAEGATRRRIQRTVVQHAQPLLDVQRAWFLPQGIEADPQSIPSLDAALGIELDPHRDGSNASVRTPKEQR